MKPFTSTSNVPPAPPLSRRQPVRQTRTNPTRSTTSTSHLRGSIAEPQDNTQPPNHGFFPAITHFTDSIGALPKEMARNYSMLKEVDAKIYGPEEYLATLIARVCEAPLPSKGPVVSSLSGSEPIPAMETMRGKSNHGRVGSPNHQCSEGGTNGTRAAIPQVLNSSDLPRRDAFSKLYVVMSEMLGTLDEKNHVLSNAIDELDKQLARCNSSFVHIDKEICEEARIGSRTHWAYNSKSPEKKGTLAGERTRRETAAANHTSHVLGHHDTDGVASRSEMRREALAARKQRSHHLDSDFDDSRALAQAANRRVLAVAKGRKAPESTMSSGSIGLGIANGTTSVVAAAPPAKRRKVEKQPLGAVMGGVPMERAMSSVYGPTASSLRGGVASPRDPQLSDAAKKKGRSAGLSNGTARRRL